MTIERAYLKDIEVAEMLGRGKNWFCANRPLLEREGFPKIDGLIGLTCRWDVEAWIARRRQVADADEAETKHIGTHPKHSENMNAF